MLALTTAFVSCNDNEVFEKEMYRNEVALISSDSYNIFEEVVKNIEASIKEYPRVVDIILYYPSIGFGYFMDHETNFERVQKIKNIKYRFNNRECFDIFRYYPE